MKIRRLSEQLVNRIAAGEVVERPAAALKELVENALDAGASHIDILLRESGQALIRVADNGEGMTAEELALSIERHATSKLPDEDLWNIQSFGFRGEALPSISAVSRLSISSRKMGADDAWQLTIEGGEVFPIKPSTTAQGTVVEVRDLFFATPARLKFLKSMRAETDAAREMIERLAMAYPFISFSLQEDDKKPVSFGAPAGLLDKEAALRERLGTILGQDFMANAVSLSYERNGISLEGYAGLPTWHRPTTRQQYLFVNNRPVKDKLILGALRGAYGDLMPRGRHPAVVLFLSVPTRDVDVNVHPTKAEVRFRDSAHVRGLIVAGLRDALSKGAQFTTNSLAPQALSAMSVEQSQRQQPPSSYSLHQPTSSLRPATYQNAISMRASDITGFAENLSLTASLPPSVRTTEATLPPEQVARTGRLGGAVAQIHGTYILAQTEESFVIVDQHAAHERIVYEKMKAEMAKGNIKRQILLLPEVIDLKESESRHLLSFAQEFEKLGLVIEPFGGAVLVREVPAMLEKIDIKGLLKDLAEELADHGETRTLQDKLEHLCATIACHGSVRSGRKMNVDEMNALLRQMESTPNTGQCNHGRPTYVELSLSDLHKLFDRK
ncbi:MAG: DNA mismatch repair endonuclease MutL [Alphaproteobacteria bacterium]|jgi:DNA mismatch repair protein MutL|nr:DNA mismatch repair endonuclease MutL [Alphaproteobacteria bacterium]